MGKFIGKRNIKKVFYDNNNMIKSRTIVVLAVIALLSLGFAEEPFSSEPTSVKIGNQIWSTENLNVETFRNGDIIQEAKDNEAWLKAGQEKKPAWCYYNNDPANGKIYGKLYNWYAVNDPRGLAPDGWHIPSDSEWTVLSTYLGGKELAGGKLKSGTGWFKGGAGTNEAKFNALPGSYRWPGGVFLELGASANFWTSTQVDTGEFGINPWCYSLSNSSNKLTRDFNNRENGMSVRLLKDASK
jgi:uncharacterized protein (TIGR02145 family)